MFPAFSLSDILVTCSHIYKFSLLIVMFILAISLRHLCDFFSLSFFFSISFLICIETLIYDIICLMLLS